MCYSHASNSSEDFHELHILNLRNESNDISIITGMDRKPKGSHNTRKPPHSLPWMSSSFGRPDLKQKFSVIPDISKARKALEEEAQDVPQAYQMKQGSPTQRFDSVYRPNEEEVYNDQFTGSPIPVSESLQLAVNKNTTESQYYGPNAIGLGDISIAQTQDHRVVTHTRRPATSDEIIARNARMDNIFTISGTRQDLMLYDKNSIITGIGNKRPIEEISTNEMMKNATLGYDISILNPLTQLEANSSNIRGTDHLYVSQLDESIDFMPDHDLSIKESNDIKRRIAKVDRTLITGHKRNTSIYGGRKNVISGTRKESPNAPPSSYGMAKQVQSSYGLFPLKSGTVLDANKLSKENQPNIEAENVCVIGRADRPIIVQNEFDHSPYGTKSVAKRSPNADVACGDTKRTQSNNEITDILHDKIETTNDQSMNEHQENDINLKTNSCPNQSKDPMLANCQTFEVFRLEKDFIGMSRDQETIDLQQVNHEIGNGTEITEIEDTTKTSENLKRNIEKVEVQRADPLDKDNIKKFANFTRKTRTNESSTEISSSQLGEKIALENSSPSISSFRNSDKSIERSKCFSYETTDSEKNSKHGPALRQVLEKKAMATDKEGRDKECLDTKNSIAVVSLKKKAEVVKVELASDKIFCENGGNRSRKLGTDVCEKEGNRSGKLDTTKPRIYTKACNIRSATHKKETIKHMHRLKLISEKSMIDVVHKKSKFIDASQGEASCRDAGFKKVNISITEPDAVRRKCRKRRSERAKFQQPINCQASKIKPVKTNESAKTLMNRLKSTKIDIEHGKSEADEDKVNIPDIILDDSEKVKHGSCTENGNIYNVNRRKRTYKEQNVKTYRQNNGDDINLSGNTRCNEERSLKGHGLAITNIAQDTDVKVRNLKKGCSIKKPMNRPKSLSIQGNNTPKITSDGEVFRTKKKERMRWLSDEHSDEFVHYTSCPERSEMYRQLMRILDSKIGPERAATLRYSNTITDMVKNLDKHPLRFGRDYEFIIRFRGENIYLDLTRLVSLTNPGSILVPKTTGTYDKQNLYLEVSRELHVQLPEPDKRYFYTKPYTNPFGCKQNVGKFEGKTERDNIDNHTQDIAISDMHSPTIVRFAEEVEGKIIESETEDASTADQTFKHRFSKNMEIDNHSSNEDEKATPGTQSSASGNSVMDNAFNDEEVARAKDITVLSRATNGRLDIEFTKSTPTARKASFLNLFFRKLICSVAENSETDRPSSDNEDNPTTGAKLLSTAKDDRVDIEHIDTNTISPAGKASTLNSFFGKSICSDAENSEMDNHISEIENIPTTATLILSTAKDDKVNSKHMNASTTTQASKASRLNYFFRKFMCSAADSKEVDNRSSYSKDTSTTGTIILSTTKSGKTNIERNDTKMTQKVRNVSKQKSFFRKYLCKDTEDAEIDTNDSSKEDGRIADTILLSTTKDDESNNELTDNKQTQTSIEASRLSSFFRRLICSGSENMDADTCLNETEDTLQTGTFILSTAKDERTNIEHVDNQKTYSAKKANKLSSFFRNLACIRKTKVGHHDI